MQWPKNIRPKRGHSIYTHRWVQYLNKASVKKDDVLKIIESTAISIASSFPVISSIATGWNEYKNHIQTKNVEFILNEFFDDLKRIESKIDKSYIDSEDFKALMVKTCFSGKEEVSVEKKKYLAHFLSNSTTKEHSRESIKNSVLETVLKLTPLDIKILSFINDNTKLNWNNSDYVYNPTRFNDGQKVPESDIIDSFRNIRMMDIISTLNYLVVNGVIEDISSQNTEINDRQIKGAVVRSQLEELQNEHYELISNKKLTPEKEQYLKKTESELNEKLNYYPSLSRYQGKFYSVSALGVKVISYIVSP